MNTTAHTQTPEATATSRVPNLGNPQGGKQDLHQQITDRSRAGGMAQYLRREADVWRSMMH
ncbi:MAG: hypothetical protein ACYCVY_12135 [Acidiferrobacteraceae bacterium]